MKSNNFLSSIGGKWANFKISEKAKLWLIAPILILVIAIVVVGIIGGLSGSITEGLNVGIDFEGGTIITVKFGEGAYTSNENYEKNVEDVSKTIEQYGVKVTYVQSSISGVTENSAITFRYKNISSNDGEIAKLNTEIQSALKAQYPTHEDDAAFITTESIGKTASKELITKAVAALGISTLLILIYIIFRFEVVSGIVAVITMLHDVIIMFALTLIFRVQINSSYVAAAITIISYAINNTIIIFDRCREIIKPYKGKKGIVYEEIGDRAIKDTLTRQLYTTFTTLITVFLLAVLGGPSIREFTLPIIFGLVAGLYSSMLIATPIWSKLSYVAERIRDKRLEKKNTVVYETIDDTGNIVEEEVVREKAVKKPAVNKTYKYTKKNTTFKKKK